MSEPRTDIRPFRVDIPQAQLDDLVDRLARRALRAAATGSEARAGSMKGGECSAARHVMGAGSGSPPLLGSAVTSVTCERALIAFACLPAIGREAGRARRPCTGTCTRRRVR